MILTFLSDAYIIFLVHDLTCLPAYPKYVLYIFKWLQRLNIKSFMSMISSDPPVNALIPRVGAWIIFQLGCNNSYDHLPFPNVLWYTRNEKHLVHNILPLEAETHFMHLHALIQARNER